jgi:hypothetical protein
MGGPRLIFDHQMCMDLDKNTIYVFGGRILSWFVFISIIQSFDFNSTFYNNQNINFSQHK